MKAQATGQSATRKPLVVLPHPKRGFPSGNTADHGDSLYKPYP